jgi:hypothetical protein
MSDTHTPQAAPVPASACLLDPGLLPDTDLRCRIDTRQFARALRRAQTVCTSKGVTAAVQVNVAYGTLTVTGFDWDRLVVAAIPTAAGEADIPGAACLDPGRALTALRGCTSETVLLVAAGPAIAVAGDQVSAFARTDHNTYPAPSAPRVPTGPAHKRGTIPSAVLAAMSRAAAVVPRGRGPIDAGLHLSIGDGRAEITAGCAGISTRQTVPVDTVDGPPEDLEAMVAAAHWPALARAGADLIEPWEVSVDSDTTGVWLHLRSSEPVRLRTRVLFDAAERADTVLLERAAKESDGPGARRDRASLLQLVKRSGAAIEAAQLQPAAPEGLRVDTAAVHRALATIPDGRLSIHATDEVLRLTGGGAQTVVPWRAA